MRKHAFAQMANYRPVSTQKGIALAVSLILLVVVTLLGIAGVRATTMQQRMATNFFDRGLAFQNAEAGLRVAEQSLSTSAVGIRNCGAGGVVCYTNPFDDPNLDKANQLITVRSADYNKGGNVVSQPQYVIEDLGDFRNPDTSTGFSLTANSQQYGAQGLEQMSKYFRITTRSGTPEASGDRSIVTLQAIYQR